MTRRSSTSPRPAQSRSRCVGGADAPLRAWGCLGCVGAADAGRLTPPGFSSIAAIRVRRSGRRTADASGQRTTARGASSALTPIRREPTHPRKRGKRKTDGRGRTKEGRRANRGRSDPKRSPVARPAAPPHTAGVAGLRERPACAVSASTIEPSHERPPQKGRVRGRWRATLSPARSGT